MDDLNLRVNIDQQNEEVFRHACAVLVKKSHALLNRIESEHWVSVRITGEKARGKTTSIRVYLDGMFDNVLVTPDDLFTEKHLRFFKNNEFSLHGHAALDLSAENLD